MLFEDGVYISGQPEGLLGADAFSLAEAEELIPGITEHVQILLDTRTLEEFDRVSASIKKGLDQSELKPTNIGIDGGEVTSNRLILREGFRLSDLLMTVGMHLIANQNDAPPGPTGKFTQWGKPYSGKRKNRVVS